MLSTTKGDLEEGCTGAPLAREAEAAAGPCCPPEEFPGRAVVGVASGAGAVEEDTGPELLVVVVGEGSLEEEDLGEEASFLAAAALRSTLLRLCVLRLLRFDSVGPSEAAGCEEGEGEEAAACEEGEEAAAA